ncbi:MAG: DUF4476 domain-containing protein [Flavobacteriaceae bacterium]|nr:DUF4476 domain-containing protein [Flavobacteriaceae bacterium]
MKKILLIALLIFSNSIFSQQSSLSVFSERGDEFYLYLNNIRQNETPEINIIVDGLTSKYYQVKILFVDKNLSQIQKNYLKVIDSNEKSGEVAYKIKENKNGELALLYASFTPFTEVLLPNDNTAVVHHNTTPMPEIGVTTQMLTTNNDLNEDNFNVGINIDGFNVGVNVSNNSLPNDNVTAPMPEIGVVTTTTQTVTTTTTTNNDGLNGDNFNLGMNVNINDGILDTPADADVTTSDAVIVETTDCYILNNTDFNDAFDLIKSKSFSDSKLILAKQITKSNCLTVIQIKKITTLFTFEDTKLEFAKYAYHFCYNPESYWKINGAFSYESSIEELNEFIESQN